MTAICPKCKGTGRHLSRTLTDTLDLIGTGAWSAETLAAWTHIERTAANQRLEKLRALGLVDRWKHGRTWIYRAVRL